MLTQTSPPSYKTGPARKSFSHLQRRMVLGALKKVRHGRLQVRDGSETWQFGTEDEAAPAAIVVVRDPSFYRRLLFGGTVSAGEAYADGLWDTDDLTMVVRLMVANRDVLKGLNSALSRRAKKVVEKIVHIARSNTRAGSRRNIAAHYDLSNEFFRLWLDSRMMYSSAVFDGQGLDLEAASTAKLRKLCELLELQPGEHLLEIGSGWGGMAIFAASHYGVRVTTITISQAQFAEAQSRVRAAGLEDQIEVRLEDYRDVTGLYDKIVSVEMVEAVGNSFLDGYFHKVESLLAPAGRFVMQAITIQDQYFMTALKEVDFIKKHIFPGGFLPSVTRLVNAAASTKTLKLTGLSDIGLDYAKTLSCWSDNFAACSDELNALGFDERFQRLWQFYFSYCEGGFLERFTSDVQVVFSNRPPPLLGNFGALDAGRRRG